MNEIEERLRGAFHADADTVGPGSIRDLADLATGWSRPARGRAGGRPRPLRRRSRALIPVGAAAAVTGIAVLVALVLPLILTGQKHGGTGPSAARSAGPKFLVAADANRNSLEVRNVDTGALAATIKPPAEPGREVSMGTVAAVNGRSFVVVMYRPSPCRSWLYQFRLNGQGKPTALTPFSALAQLPYGLLSLAFSRNGQQFAYWTSPCRRSPHSSDYLNFIDIATKQTRRWTAPPGLDGVSLSGNGRLLAYSTEIQTSVVRVIPTNAASGSAAARGRTVVRAAQFGHSAIIGAQISSNGKLVYFATYPLPMLVQGPEAQVRVASVATGRSRTVYAPAGEAGTLAADPGVRHLLMQMWQQTRRHESVKLVKLDLATGNIRYLPSRWTATDGGVPIWIVW
jgi:hypothetical protein